MQIVHFWEKIVRSCTILPYYYIYKVVILRQINN